MKKFSLVILAYLIMAGIGNGDERTISSSDRADAEIRVMTFNIRCRTFMDGMNHWWFRRDHVAELVLRHDPDIIGMQEVRNSQARDLERMLPDYAWFGLPRGDGERRGERCSIFYRKDRFELIEHSTFWLSETPEVPGSKSWGSACKRVVTWGKFRDKKSGRVLFHFNTHFDHVSIKARRMSARLIVEKIGSIAGDIPAVVTGDFNTTDTSIPYQTMTSLLLDSRVISQTPTAGPCGTSRGFGIDSQPGRRIDYIFVSKGMSIKDYAVLEDTYKNGRRPSDHMPVIADVTIP